VAADFGPDRPSQRQDPIKIVPYGAQWPTAFAREQTRIEAAPGNHLVGRVEHIGSTAIPGLAAKPIAFSMSVSLPCLGFLSATVMSTLVQCHVA
jgi:hypothetical protein